MSKKLYTQFNPVFFEKTRLSMLTILHAEETVSFNRFKNILGGTDGSIYSHIQKLIKADYIQQKKNILHDRLQTEYSLTEKGKRAFKKYIDFLENMLETNRRKE